MSTPIFILGNPRLRRLISPDAGLCVYWSPKAGCSSAVEMFFDSIGYDHSRHTWIHDARQEYQRKQPREPGDPCVRLQVVRNPYDRAVSSFLHYMRYCRRQLFDDWIKSRSLVDENPNNPGEVDAAREFNRFFFKVGSGQMDCATGSYHAKPQFQTDRLDDLIRIESFDDDVSRVNGRFGLSLGTKRYDPHGFRRIMGDDAYEGLRREFYSHPHNRRMIEEIYRRDFESFGYAVHLEGL